MIYLSKEEPIQEPKKPVEIGHPIRLQLETQQLLLKMDRLEKAIQTAKHVNVMLEDYFIMLKAEVSSFIQRQQYKQSKVEESGK